MNITTQQLQKKFKHAADFGVTGEATKANLAAFEQALQNHVAGDNTAHVAGSFRGQEAILHVDPNTSLVVITDKTANFVSGWRLSGQQLEYALREESLEVDSISMEAAVSKYVELIEQFVSGAIDVRTFESSYLKMFKNESAHLSDTAFTVLDQLFADVDAFCADPLLRGESDLDEDELRSHSSAALRELTAVAEER